MGRLKDTFLSMHEAEVAAAGDNGVVPEITWNDGHADFCGIRTRGICDCETFDVKARPIPSDPYGGTWPQTNSEGRKDDSGKTWRPGLIAVEFIRGIATVLAFGAIKYAPGNWAKGMAWSRPIDALDRHWTAWKGGEKCDPETGYSHLWHAGCCLMFLVAYEARGIGTDDRSEVGMKAQ